MRTLPLTAALIAATVSTAAIAADWVLVAEDVNDNTFYIARDSIRTMPNGYKRAWMRSYSSEPNVNGDTGYRALEEYDCREGRWRWLQIAWFKAEAVTLTDNTVSEWSYVAPDTISESLLNYVCFSKLD